jgi:hypothetical protein
MKHNGVAGVGGKEGWKGEERDVHFPVHHKWQLHNSIWKTNTLKLISFDYFYLNRGTTYTPTQKIVTSVTQTIGGKKKSSS